MSDSDDSAMRHAVERCEELEGQLAALRKRHDQLWNLLHEVRAQLHGSQFRLLERIERVMLEDVGGSK